MSVKVKRQVLPGEVLKFLRHGLATKVKAACDSDEPDRGVRYSRPGDGVEDYTALLAHEGCPWGDDAERDLFQGKEYGTKDLAKFAQSKAFGKSGLKQYQLCDGATNPTFWCDKDIAHPLLIGWEEKPMSNIPQVDQ